MKKKYMDSLSRHQRNSRVGIKYPRCVECAGGNIQELKCVMCDTTKSLDHFARTQRRKPDDAHCKDCSQEKVDREPNHADEVEEVAIIQEMEALELAGYSSRISSAMSARRSQLSSSRHQYETDTNPGSNIYDGNDEVSLPDTRHAEWSDSGSGLSVRSSLNGHGNLAGSPTGRSNMIARGRNTGFAKQNAVPRDKYQKADDTRQRNERIRQQQEEQAAIAESDSDDDGDDEYPY